MIWKHDQIQKFQSKITNDQEKIQQERDVQVMECRSLDTTASFSVGELTVARTKLAND
jgi:hypothetical protein